MSIGDYESVLELLSNIHGVRLREADSRAATNRYLQRNPGLSFVACIDEKIIGCVMGGHDGRRGYLQHLAVDQGHRRKGIAKALVQTALSKLESLGILKIHIDVLVENQDAQSFWQSMGWTRRNDILKFSYLSGDNINA